MLGLGLREGRENSRVGVRADGTHSRCCAFGGIGFELLAEPGAPMALEPDDERFLVPPGSAPTAAEVVCSVVVDHGVPVQPGAEGNVLRSAHEGGRVLLEAAGLRAELTTVGHHRYAVRARIAAGPAGFVALLRGVGAVTLDLVGGLTLHAVGVAIDGRAVVYLGPSGAGKSTAARLTADGRAFADDHVALVPSSNGWLAWGLPGGSPTRMAVSDGAVFPVATLLRVRHGQGRPTLSRLSGAAALFAVRGAVESGDSSVEAEASRLASAMRIAREVDVGVIHTVPGEPLTRELGAWFSAQTHDRADVRRSANA